MTIRQVLKMGDPLLLNIAEPVHDFKSQALKVLIEDMQDTMHALNGAGLAAPQIGCLLYTSPSPRDVEESRMPSSA